MFVFREVVWWDCFGKETKASVALKYVMFVDEGVEGKLELDGMALKGLEKVNEMILFE